MNVSSDLIYLPSCCSKLVWYAFFCITKRRHLKKVTAVFIHTMNVNGVQWGHEGEFNLMLGLWNCFMIKLLYCRCQMANTHKRIVSPFLFFLMFFSYFWHKFFSFSLSLSLFLSFSHLWMTENTDSQPSWLENRGKYPLLTVVKLNHCLPFMSGHIVSFFDVGLLLWQCFAPYLEKHPDGGKGERGKLVSTCHLSSVWQDILLM